MDKTLRHKYLSMAFHPRYVFDVDALKRAIRAFRERHGVDATTVHYNEVNLGDYLHRDNPGGGLPDVCGLQLRASSNETRAWFYLGVMVRVDVDGQIVADE